MQEKDRLSMIREIQLVNFKSLKKLDYICRKYNIKYWVAYGTLIGAIRHEGFIPWDDDLDVGMLREDFDKLCKIPEKEWGSDTLLRIGQSDDERHDKVFARVYQKNTRIQSYTDVDNWLNASNDYSWSTSMMCDIFIFDYVPDNDYEWRCLYKKTNYYKNVYKYLKLRPVIHKHKMVDCIKRSLKRLYGITMRTLYKNPWKKVMDDMEFKIKSSNHGKRIGTYYTTDDFLYSYDDIFPLKMCKFEDIEVPVPNNYHKMLTDMYGDYMQFPPENERVHINFIYADLGDGREYIVDPIPDSLGSKEMNYKRDRNNE